MGFFLERGCIYVCVCGGGGDYHCKILYYILFYSLNDTLMWIGMIKNNEDESFYNGDCLPSHNFIEFKTLSKTTGITECVATSISNVAASDGFLNLRDCMEMHPYLCVRSRGKLSDRLQCY